MIEINDYSELKRVLMTQDVDVELAGYYKGLALGLVLQVERLNADNERQGVVISRLTTQKAFLLKEDISLVK